MTYIKPLQLAGFMACILLWASCAVSRSRTSGVKPKEVRDLQKFEPYSYILLMEKGSEGALSDSISRRSRAIISHMLDTFRRLPITGSIAVTDTSLRKRVEEEAVALITAAGRERRVARVKLTPLLDSLLEQSGKRFGLITMTTGFTRTRKNYKRETLKGAAMGMATLGMYMEVPYKAGSSTYAVVVDAQENNVAFFKRSSLKDREPLDPAAVRQQIVLLFYNYFYR